MRDLDTRLSDALVPHIAETRHAIGVSATASAAQCCVDIAGAQTTLAMGVTSFESPTLVDDHTLFDIASVSKLFTATCALVAADRGLTKLHTPLSRWFPALEGPSLLQLLNHSSGFPAWDTYFERYPMHPSANTRDAVLDEILAARRAPPGTVYAYSDLGYILLGRIIERVFDRPLEDIIEDDICAPLGLESTRYVRLLRGDEPIGAAVATEDDPFRGELVIGVVHDKNCYIQGGVEGHAGLFSTASDLTKFGRHMLDIEADKPGIISRELLRFAWSERARGADGHHLAGWDTPSGERTSVGRGFSRADSFGHLGFTGTSLWLDRSRDVVATLLTNRVYPTRENARILQMRIDFHESVVSPSAASLSDTSA